MLKKSRMIGLAFAIILLAVSSANPANIEFSHTGRSITDPIARIPSANATNNKFHPLLTTKKSSSLVPSPNAANIEFYGGDMIGYIDIRPSQGVVQDLVLDDGSLFMGGWQALEGGMGLIITPSQGVVTGDGFLKRKLSGVLKSTGIMKQNFALKKGEYACSGIMIDGPWELTIEKITPTKAMLAEMLDVPIEELSDITLYDEIPGTTPGTSATITINGEEGYCGIIYGPDK